jgi:8-oxo-dGTP diphosphatase
MKQTEKIFPKKFIASVVFPVRDGHVCMAIKTRGIGKGKRNGYGGGVEEGEDIIECTVRELSEESRVVADPCAIKKVGFIEIQNLNEDGSLKFTCYLHVMILTSWTGEFTETEEMLDPQWFSVSHLPVEDMMPADLVWLPLILAGESLKGTLSCCGPGQELVGESTFEPCVFE